MSGAIIYRSSYGSTKQYADWIAEETGLRVLDQSTDDIPWAELDTVVIGCPVLAMKPFLAKWITENWEKMEGKTVVLFTTSGAPSGTPGLREGFKASMPPEITDRIEYFPLQGRMIWANLKPMHKLIMRIGQMIEKDTQRRKEMVTDVDGVDRSRITPIVERITAAT
jgi:menaquinone-dependent protoporphyrinogen oxidase